MSVPSGWLASPSGSGSAQEAAVLPVPAVGTYTEPIGVTPGPLPGTLVVTALLNGSGSVVGATDNSNASRATLSRLSVYGAILLDSVITVDAGGAQQCPRPAFGVITACPRPVNL